MTEYPKAKSLLAMVFGHRDWRRKAARAFGAAPSTVEGLAYGKRRLTRRQLAILENKAVRGPKELEQERQQEHAKVDADYAVRLVEVKQAMEEIRDRRRATSQFASSPIV